jgi:DNA-binding transcriptional ArsR family regulator
MPPAKRQQELRRRTLRPHPTRHQIIDVMRTYGQPISPPRLSKITGVTLGSVAYHVRTLVAAGVIEFVDEGRVLGAVEHFYALAADEEATQLTDPIETLLGLCGALTVASTNGDYPLDKQARGELRAVLDELRPKVRTIVAEASRRAAV